MNRLVAKSKIVWCCAWLFAVLAGLRMLWAYSAAPGEMAPIAAIWPGESAFWRAVDRPTLVMFLHPQCPCSASSVEELAKIVARSGERVAVKVIAVKPKDASGDWEETALLRRARALPNVELLIDEDGRAATTFGARASGHVSLYDADGQLLFAGGITAARGHAGDNAGSEAIVNIIHDRAGGAASGNVFGCALGIDDSKCVRTSKCPQ